MTTSTNSTYSVQAQGKNMIVAYLLWWFLGWAGAHRYYLRRPVSGTIQLALSVIGFITLYILVGAAFLLVWGIWWLSDVYFVQKYVSQINTELGVAASGITVNTVSQDTKQPVSAAEEIDRLHMLREKGAITDDEYQEKKGKLLDA